MKRRASTAMLLAVLALPAPQGWAGNLFQPERFQSLTSDLRPRRPGDLVTVMVYESSSASSSTDTTTGREAGVAVDLTPTGKPLGYAAGAKSSNRMEGRGQTQRAGKVLAQITVSIKSIAPNGDLQLAGQQTLEINNERQHISLEGRVRAQDVSDTNVVLSTRIADAKIRYLGDGDLSDRQRPAWWQRLLTQFGL
jgi:flagellar L-ring protein precursor FlgH